MKSHSKKAAGEGCIEGWACPKCGQHECFRVEATSWFDVYEDGTDHDGDVEWDDASRVQCAECDWEGTVSQVIVPEEERIEDDEAVAET